jgi:hypothetical protein
MQTFDSLCDQVERQLDEAGITPTRTRIEDLVNQAHQQRLTGRTWTFLRWPTTETITLTTATVYPLHSQVGLLDAMIHVQDDQPMVETSPSDVHQDDVQDQYHFIWAGTSPVKVGASLAEKPKLKSSSASDTAVTVAIRGTDSSGEIIEETLTASGTSAVTATNTFYQILSVTKSTGWVGTMTLYENDGTTAILSLGPSEYGRQYKRIELQDTPTAGETLAYTFFRLPRVLSAATDIPDIPWPCSQVLVWDALVLMAAYNEGISGQTIRLWQDMQKVWEQKLNAQYLHGRTAHAQAGRIRGGDPGGL